MFNKEASWEYQKHIMYNGLTNKGYVWMDKDELAKVEAGLKKNPDDYYLICAKGILYANYDYAIAIECCSKALSMRPFDPHQRFNRGRKYLNTDRYEEGLADLMLAVRIDPDDGWKWHYLGVAYYLLKKFDLAAKTFEKAIEVLKAHDGDILSCEADWLWTAYMHMNEPEKAKQIIDTIDRDTTIVPIIGEDIAYKNICLLLNGTYTVEEFKKTLDPSGESRGVNELYGLAKYYYYVRHDIKTAVDYCDQALKKIERKGGWGYKMAAMDRDNWVSELGNAK